MQLAKQPRVMVWNDQRGSTSPLPPAHCPKFGMPVEQGWGSPVLMMKRRVGLALLSITASWFKELVLSLLNHLKAIAGQIWVDSDHVCIAGKGLEQSSGFLSFHSACYYSPMHLQGAQMQSRGPCIGGNPEIAPLPFGFNDKPQYKLCSTVLVDVHPGKCLHPGPWA